MKLNPDCIRDILLHLDSPPTVSRQDDLLKNTVGFEPISIYDMEDSLAYSLPEIFNTVYVLAESGFLMCRTKYNRMGNISGLDIQALTDVGRQFLEMIRSQFVWDTVSRICQEIGTASIDVITIIASRINTPL